MSHITQSKVTASSRKDKKFMRTVKEVEGDKVIKEKVVHFGDPDLSIKKNDKEHQASYCARSGGIKGKNDPFSANYQSREMWDCGDSDKK